MEERRANDWIDPFLVDPTTTNHEVFSGGSLQLCTLEEGSAGVEDLSSFVYSFGLDPVQESGSL